MKSSFLLHMSRLIYAHGTYSQAARKLGYTPRAMRAARSRTASKIFKNSITAAGKNIALRSLLFELRRMGFVSDAALREAWANIDQRMTAPEVTGQP